MNEKNKLMLQMGIFFIIVFGIFTYIVIDEKKEIIMTPKVEEKLLNYIDKNYAKQKPDLNIGKIKYDKENDKYQIKLSNTKNQNLYFYVTYKKKKITDTYQKDYIEGNSLYENFMKEYNQNFENANIVFSKKLNKYPDTIQNQMISSDIKQLPVYYIEKELSIKNHEEKTILKSITNFYNENKKLGYIPKNYSLTLVDENDISFTVKIENLTEELIINNCEEIIRAIIENDSTIKSKYEIDYQYIN